MLVYKIATQTCCGKSRLDARRGNEGFCASPFSEGAWIRLGDIKRNSRFPSGTPGISGTVLLRGLLHRVYSRRETLNPDGIFILLSNSVCNTLSDTLESPSMYFDPIKLSESKFQRYFPSEFSNIWTSSRISLYLINIKIKILLSASE